MYPNESHLKCLPGSSSTYNNILDICFSNRLDFGHRDCEKQFRGHGYHRKGYISCRVCGRIRGYM